MLRSDSAAGLGEGAVIRNDTVLLVNRSPSARFWPDVWDLFGGTLMRENLWKRPCSGRPARSWGEVRALRKPGQIHDPIQPAVVHVYAISSWEGEPVNAAHDEHTEVRWFSADELPKSEGMEAYRGLVVMALG